MNKRGGMLGKKHTLEAKSKISEASKRLWQNPEYAKKMAKLAGERYRGKKLSKTHKKKLSENNARYWHYHQKSQEHCRKISETLKGHPISRKVRSQNAHSLVKHHVYLKENDPNTIITMTCAQHHSIHKRAYNYLYYRYGKKGIDSYIRWFFENYGN